MTRALRHIRLELAREPGKPEGDHRSGYGIVAPLDAEGRLDPKAARTIGKSCRVRCFADDGTVATGRLPSVGGGDSILDLPDDADDETGYRFGEERFMPGEYVSLQARDAALHTFRVAQLRIV